MLRPSDEFRLCLLTHLTTTWPLRDPQLLLTSAKLTLTLFQWTVPSFNGTIINQWERHVTLSTKNPVFLTLTLHSRTLFLLSLSYLQLISSFRLWRWKKLCNYFQVKINFGHGDAAYVSTWKLRGNGAKPYNIITKLRISHLLMKIIFFGAIAP
jgi:hypothetical protein